MRSCPTLNNNITNNYKTELTMKEDAPNATDHDDDSKRIASSYSYDLPNQEPNQEDKDDDDISFVPAFMVWPSYNGHVLGSFFGGAYLPQKWVVLPPF
jgi:hypothetical protein